MTPIKPALFLLLLCASLLVAVEAQATILPDSCGKDEIKFKVKVQEAPEGEPNPAPAPPETGKAQIIFIETVDTSGVFFTTPTTRFGVDGDWVGANKGNSRFAIEVTPGVHHVCVNWQSDDGYEAKKVGMDLLTAESGKIYYYDVKFDRKQQFGGGGGFMAPAMGPGGGFASGGGYSFKDVSFAFSQVGDDEAKYLVKSTPPSTSKSRVQKPQIPQD